MPKIVFKRRLIDNRGSLQLTIPKEIVEALGLKKREQMAISLEGERIVCERIVKEEE